MFHLSTERFLCISTELYWLLLHSPRNMSKYYVIARERRPNITQSVDEDAETQNLGWCHHQVELDSSVLRDFWLYSSP